MFVPGAKRASTGGESNEGGGSVWGGVGDEGGVGDGRGVGDGGGVGDRGGVGDGGAPAVTVRLAEVVVSKNAVMVTDVLFADGECCDREAGRRLATWDIDNAWYLGNGRITRSKRNKDAAGRRRSAQEYSSGGVRAAADASRTNRHRLQQRRSIWVRTYVDEN